MERRRDGRRPKEHARREIEEHLLAEAQMHEVLTAEEREEAEWQRQFREGQAMLELELRELRYSEKGTAHDD